jgi:flagellar biosynthetic protein FlhB
VADDAERTETATPKRRGEAREKGDVAQSREVAAALLLSASFLVLASSFGADVVKELVAQTRAGLASAAAPPAQLEDFHAALLLYVGRAGRALIPIAGLLLLVAFFSHFVQVGPLFSWKAVAVRASRLNPLTGMKRLLGVDAAVELGKSLAKVALVGAAAWLVLRPALGSVLALPAAGVWDGVAMTGSVVHQLALGALAGLAALAAADYGWVRMRYERRLRMTRQEVRDELRQREGDPRLRARMRAFAQELSRHRMIADVARADVVVTNPTHYAVALRYARGEMGAPKVLARGRSHLALRIREQARRELVPIVENPPLARALYRETRVGKEIPESLYQAVAEVLAYVWRLDPRRRAAWGAAL